MIDKIDNKFWVVIAFALVIAILRFAIPSHELSWAGAYEAFAHLFVGGLIGAWLVSRKRLFLILVLAMSAIELIAFFSR